MPARRGGASRWVCSGRTGPTIGKGGRYIKCAPVDVTIGKGDRCIKCAPFDVTLGIWSDGIHPSHILIAKLGPRCDICAAHP